MRCRRCASWRATASRRSACAWTARRRRPPASSSARDGCMAGASCWRPTPARPAGIFRGAVRSRGHGAALLYGAALPLDLLGRAPGVRHVRARQIDFIGNESGAGAGRRRCRRLDADQRDRRAGRDRGGGRLARRVTGDRRSPSPTSRYRQSRQAETEQGHRGRLWNSDRHTCAVNVTQPVPIDRDVGQAERSLEARHRRRCGGNKPTSPHGTRPQWSVEMRLQILASALCVGRPYPG